MEAKIICVISTIILLSGLSMIVLCDESDGAEPVTITDWTGWEFEYSEPTERIVTMGYASTLTVAMLGEIDKIIAVDKYSTYEYTNDERLKDLDAEDLGSIYSSSNNDLIVTQFLQWVEDGKMSLDDTIILTTYNNAKVLRELLIEHGFSKILIYLTITEYDQIVDFVNSLSIIVTGEKSKIVDNMELVKATIYDGLKDVTEKAKGLSVWYSTSSGSFSVGNTGSIAVSLFEAAGGTNIAYSPNVDSSTYGDASTIIQLVDANRDVVIFLQDSYLRDHTISDFRNEVLGGDKSITIIPIKSVWNNYCPDAADGLWTFACALYPNIFEGPVPAIDDEPSGSNLLLYAAAGIVVVTVILIAAYIIMKRP